MRRVFWTVMVLTVLAVPRALPAEEESALTLAFLDAGEGDAILVEAPDGTKALVDSGNLVSGVSVLKRLRRGRRELQALIFTHPHLDHIGGAFSILQLFPVKRIFDNGQDLGDRLGEEEYRWYSELVRSDPRYASLGAGDAVDVGPARLEVLWPPKEARKSSDWNANSLVLMIRFGRFRALLMGDAGIETERALQDRKADLNAAVLKIGHHGGPGTCSTPFLRMVSPKLAIVSVNRGNRRGYPSGDTLAAVKQAGIALRRTDRDGDIVLSAFADGRFE